MIDEEKIKEWTLAYYLFGFFSQGEYKSPVETELQKFGKSGQEQLELFGPKVEESPEVEVTGLDFNVSQDKAFGALQKLLADNNYRGQSQKPHYDDIREDYYKLPKIEINYSDYYEAYGLERDSSGKYTNRRQVKQAKQALREMELPWRITVSKKRENGKYDVATKRTQLVEIERYYYNREEDEKVRIQKGQATDKANRLVIIYQPLFIAKIQDFYVLKDPELHKRIRETVDSKRYSEAVPRFIDWLNTTNYEAKYNKDFKWWKDPHTIGREKLAYKLRLDGYIERRQWSYIDDRIEQACEVAQDLDFLFKYDLESEPIKLWLNPFRCSRLGYQLKKQDKLPPRLTDDRV